MSNHIARQTVSRDFKQKLVNNYLLRREQERFEIYSKAQAIAMEDGDLEEVARIEAKLKTLILE